MRYGAVSICRFVAGLCIVVGAALPIYAQEADTTGVQEVDVRADLLEGGEEEGERIRRLIGNVRLQQEDTRLRARRAIQFPERREILFTGDVLVIERGDTLRADTVLYNSRDKTGHARGGIRLSDGDVLLEAPSGLYFTRSKRARFSEGVTLTDRAAVLTSLAGEYFSDEKRADFYGDVVLVEDNGSLRADTVTYHRETDISLARGNVFVERVDTTGQADPKRQLVRSLLFGDRAYNEDSTGYSRMEGDPLLLRIREDSTGADTDTLMVRARILESSRRDSLERLVAVDSVRILHGALTAVADSVVYDRITAGGEDGADIRRTTARFFDNPLAWFQDNQVSGDTLQIKGRGEEIDSLFVLGSAFAARPDSATNRIHQLRGKRIDAAFEQDSLRTLSAGPQAEAIHFRSSEDGLAEGAVHMSADRILLHFREGDIDRLEAIRDTEGVYYSEEILPDSLSLDGFVWRPERRPVKREFLQRVEWQGRDGFQPSDAPDPLPEPMD